MRDQRPHTVARDVARRRLDGADVMSAPLFDRVEAEVGRKVLDGAASTRRGARVLTVELRPRVRAAVPRPGAWLGELLEQMEWAV